MGHVHRSTVSGALGAPRRRCDALSRAASPAARSREPRIKFTQRRVSAAPEAGLAHKPLRDRVGKRGACGAAGCEWAAARCWAARRSCCRRPGARWTARACRRARARPSSTLCAAARSSRAAWTSWWAARPEARPGCGPAEADLHAWALARRWPLLCDARVPASLVCHVRCETPRASRAARCPFWGRGKPACLACKQAVFSRDGQGQARAGLHLAIWGEVDPGSGRLDMSLGLPARALAAVGLRVPPETVLPLAVKGTLARPAVDWAGRANPPLRSACEALSCGAPMAPPVRARAWSSAVQCTRFGLLHWRQYA